MDMTAQSGLQPVCNTGPTLCTSMNAAPLVIVGAAPASAPAPGAGPVARHALCVSLYIVGVWIRQPKELNMNRETGKGQPGRPRTSERVWYVFRHCSRGERDGLVYRGTNSTENRPGSV